MWLLLRGWLATASWTEIPYLCYLTGAVNYPTPCPSSVVKWSKVWFQTRTCDALVPAPSPVCLSLLVHSSECFCTSSRSDNLRIVCTLLESRSNVFFLPVHLAYCWANIAECSFLLFLMWNTLSSKGMRWNSHIEYPQLHCNISKEMVYNMAGFLCSCFSIRLKCTIWYLETIILNGPSYTK